MEIPNSVTKIGTNAFCACSNLSNIVLSNSVDSIKEGTFSYCINMLNVTIPNSVTYIGDNAFTFCTVITNVVIGNSVISIGSNAFSSCYKLKEIIIPNSVISIGNNAFSICSALVNLSISKSINTIGANAFLGCNMLKTIYVYAPTPVNLTSSIDVFLYVDKRSCILYVPTGSKNSYKYANQWSDFQNIIEITTALPSISQSKINATTGNGILTLSNTEIGDKVEIYNVSGLKIKECYIENIQTIIALKTGIYILRIGDYSSKVIIL
jgi:hypothetical protein